MTTKTCSCKTNLGLYLFLPSFSPFFGAELDQFFYISISLLVSHVDRKLKKRLPAKEAQKLTRIEFFLNFNRKWNRDFWLFKYRSLSVD